MEIRIEGIEEVCARLEAAPRTLVKRAFLKAARAAARPLQEALRARTPRRTDRQGGDAAYPSLANSQVTIITLDSALRGVMVEVGFGKQGYIANFVEYGHRQIGHDPKKIESAGVEPRPFMRRAIDSAAEAMVEEFAAVLAEELEGGVLNNAA